jgi:PmbA protein
VNTLGVDLEEDRTWAYIYLGATGEHQGEVTPSCYDVMVTRKRPLQPERVGGNVAEDVTRLFKPRPVESFEGTAIFAPEATSYQIADVMLDALKGENVMAERSPWTRKVGHRVASEKLTVKDDALLEDGFSSRAFDDEGYPSKETLLIRDGELVGFLHDATTSNALDVENTGNASRSPGGFELVHSIIGTGYRAKPEVYSSNFTITPGSRKTEKLVSEVERGVLVESMAGFPQSGSGIVSAQLSRAFYIEEGEVKHPIKGGMVTGVAFNWLKNISAVSSELKAYFKGVVPSLQVENVKIVGS